MYDALLPHTYSKNHVLARISVVKVSSVGLFGSSLGLCSFPHALIAHSLGLFSFSNNARLNDPFCHILGMNTRLPSLRLCVLPQQRNWHVAVPSPRRTSCMCDYLRICRVSFQRNSSHNWFRDGILSASLVSQVSKRPLVAVPVV